MSAVLTIVAIFVVGFVAGYLNKGINITYNNSNAPVVQEREIAETQQQNEDLTKLLDPEVTKWFQDNNGMIK